MNGGHGWWRRGSVWACGQESARVQRREYAPSSTPHPAKMLPEIARHAITAYSRPGDVVFDPMCGIGTTLAEAVRCGRNAVGVEYEPRWAAVAAANLHLALRDAPEEVTTTLVTGDARDLVNLLPADLAGRVQLVVMSPPYGSSTHLRTIAEPGHRFARKVNRVYGTDRANLAYRPLPELRQGLAAILSGCASLLAADGKIVVTARPYRLHGVLVDFPGLVVAAALEAGLVPLERCVALMAGWHDGRLLARPSFFQLKNVRRAREAHRLASVIVHEDVLVFGRDTPSPDTGRGPGRGARS